MLELPHTVKEIRLIRRPQELFRTDAPPVMPTQDPLLLAVLLNLWMAAASDLMITLIPTHPLVNQTVTLSLNGVQGNLVYSKWYRGSDTSSDNRILTYEGGVENKGGKYIMGARGQANGSLVIDNLQKAYEGNYTVDIFDDQRARSKTVFLPVYDNPVNSGLSGGAIAGIVIGTAVAALLIGGLTYMFIKKKPEGPL